MDQHGPVRQVRGRDGRHDDETVFDPLARPEGAEHASQDSDWATHRSNASSQDPGATVVRPSRAGRAQGAPFHPPYAL